jgi:hypothetical protein
MESKDDKLHPKTGRIGDKVLPLERRVTKDISQEPEMKELERMIRERELKSERVFEYIEGEDDGKGDS